MSDWGAAKSAEILFHPAHKIEFSNSEIRFIGRQLTYTCNPTLNRWGVTKSLNKTNHNEGWGMQGESQPVPSKSGPLEFKTPEPGVLELVWSHCSLKPARLTLWTREQLGRIWLQRFRQILGRPPATQKELAQQICVSDVYISDSYEDSQNLWLAIRFYAGEACAGIGTIVQIKKSTCRVQIHQPRNLSLVSVSHIVGAGGELWLGTEHFGEGSIGPGLGLVRYDPKTGTVKPLGKTDPTTGSYITAMARRGQTLWVATLDGFHALNLQTQQWLNWRIVPQVRLTRKLPVSNLPGGKPRGAIPPGDYEVVWVGDGWLEILTPSCASGFVETAWYNMLAARKFNRTIDAIATSVRWGAYGLSLFNSVPDNPQEARPDGWFLRAPAKQIGQITRPWLRCRICAGWIEFPAENVRLTVQRLP